MWGRFRCLVWPRNLEVSERESQPSQQSTRGLDERREERGREAGANVPRRPRDCACYWQSQQRARRMKFKIYKYSNNQYQKWTILKCYLQLFLRLIKSWCLVVSQLKFESIILYFELWVNWNDNNKVISFNNILLSIQSKINWKCTRQMVHATNFVLQNKFELI